VGRTLLSVIAHFQTWYLIAVPTVGHCCPSGSRSKNIQLCSPPDITPPVVQQGVVPHPALRLPNGPLSCCFCMQSLLWPPAPLFLRPQCRSPFRYQKISPPPRLGRDSHFLSYRTQELAQWFVIPLSISIKIVPHALSSRVCSLSLQLSKQSLCSFLDLFSHGCKVSSYVMLMVRHILLVKVELQVNHLVVGACTMGSIQYGPSCDWLAD